ncbi:MAG: alpha/beta fold hydrolase [Chloroflexia bacterium]
MPFQEVNGVQLYYEDEGQGTPVLLLHGAFSTARSQFGHVMGRLAERGYRVLAPDRRGYGRSRPPQIDYPPDFYHRDMDDVARLLRALDAQPAHVVGISDGGVIGLLLGIEHPELVRSIVAWAANAEWPLEERGQYEHLLGAGQSLEFMQQMHERHGMTKAEAQAMLADYVAASLALTDGEWEPGLAGHMSEIPCPVLVGAGGMGDFLPLHHAEQQAREIPRAELWIQPKVGHFWPMTQQGGEVFIGRVLNWLVQNG